MKARSESQDTPVLVVDDEQDIRDGCERILSRAGYRVLQAATGYQAFTLLKKNRISIILLDLKMPGMDGLDVLKRLREYDPNILVIVITGYATVETAIEAMKRGAYDFIAKPFEPDSLRIVVARAAEKVRLLQEAVLLEEERRRTLGDLAAEKSRTRTIIESLPNGVVVTNAQGQVVLMNPAFLSLLDLDPSAQTGKPFASYIGDEAFCNFVMEICRSGKPKPDYSFELSLPGDRYILAKGEPVIGEDRACLGAVLTLMDITALKALDRLKSEFVAAVSHELRSPLSTIHEQLALVLKDMLEGRTGKDQKDLLILSRALEKTHGLISLVGDLLDLSRIESGSAIQPPKPVRLGELLQSIVDFLAAKAKAKGQRLTLSLPREPLPSLMSDPLALESVFGNLITNAINYTPEKGRIRVTARAGERNIRVAVADSGIGIEEKDLERIFNRFYRVKNEKTRYITGTGLGLPIVKGLLDGLGGAIKVSSAPGKGSTFTVTLPLGKP